MVRPYIAKYFAKYIIYNINGGCQPSPPFLTLVAVLSFSLTLYRTYPQFVFIYL